MRINRMEILSLLIAALWSAGACDDSREVLDPDNTDPTPRDSDPIPTNTDPDPETTECAPASTVVGTHGKLRVEEMDLVNECGDYVQLKGISSMWLNWEYDGYALSREGMKWMIDNWNISVFRAAMGTEEQYGYLYNEASKQQILDQVTTIVDNAIALGIYVIIDWHTHQASSQTAEAKQFFTDMAKRYGEYPNVMYETWNEPLEVSWTNVVKPYHEAVVSAIRAVDPDNIIILGTPRWSQLVTSAIDEPVAGTNLMYALHFYSCTHLSEIASEAWYAYNSGVPIFVSEWGATHADGGLDGVVCEQEANRWMRTLNDMGASWAAWKLDGCNDASCILAPGAPVVPTSSNPWTNYLHGHGSYVVEQLLK